MSMSFVVAVAASVAAVAFVGLLARRCARARRLDVGALAAGAAVLTVALIAQAAGSLHGYDPVTFRAVHLFAQTFAPLALIWAMVELAGESVESRFLTRLGLGALTLIGTVVLATDPLLGAAFTSNWPPASTYYGIFSNAVLEVVAIIATLSALLAVVVAGVRARREGGVTVLLAVAMVAAAAALTDALRLSLGVNAGYAVICLACVVLAWLAARWADMVPAVTADWQRDAGGDERDLPAGRDRYPSGPVRGVSDEGYSGLYRDEPGWDRGAAPRADPFGEVGPVTGMIIPGAGAGAPDAVVKLDPAGGAAGDVPGPRTGDIRAAGRQDGFDVWFRRAPDPPGTNGDPDDVGTDPGLGPPRGPGGVPGLAAFETGDVLSAAEFAGAGDLAAGTASAEPASGSRHPDQGGVNDSPVPGGTGGRDQDEDSPRLYGQIAIYTLFDGKADEFDQLAHELVDEVKTREPGALVYVMHGVPSAPMQRILYEVYRDEEAFASHGHQPHVRRFEDERKPCVLATNVIELGVRHGAFASLADALRSHGFPDGAAPFLAQEKR